MKLPLVYVKNIDSSLLDSIVSPPSSLTWKQYWIAHVPLVWRDTDLFCCAVCRRMFYKTDVEMVVVKMASVRTASKSYVPVTAEEQDKLYLTPLCPTCAKGFGYEWKINKKLLVLVPQK